jgi:MFS family permease
MVAELKLSEKMPLENNKNNGHAETKFHNYLSLAIIVLASFTVSVSSGANAILFPTTMQAEKFSNSLIGSILSLEVGASIGVCLLILPLFRRINIQVALVLSTILRIASLLTLANQHSLYAWIVMVFIHGLGIFTFLLILQIWINSIAFTKYRGLMLSMYGTAISLGIAAGPVVYRYLPELNPIITRLWLSHGLPLDKPEVYGGFIVSAVISAFALILPLLGFSLTPKYKIKKGIKLFPILKKSQSVLFAIALGGVSFFGVAAFITLYGLRNGLAVEDAALLLSSFMLGSLLLEAPISFLSDFFDRRYVIVVAVLLSIVCAVFLPIAIYEKYQAYLLLFIWGGIIGAIYSMVLAVIGDTYAGAELVTANAGYSLMEGLGGAMGVFLIGLAMDAFDSDGLPYIIMLAGIVYFSYALTRYRVE